MKQLIFICFLLFTSLLHSQHASDATTPRNGFAFGFGVGVGYLHLNHNDTIHNNATWSIPNIRVGYMLNPQTELFVNLPGVVYRYQQKDRGFEAFLIGGRHWFGRNTWLAAAAGLTFDAAAFYTVKDPKKAAFYTGFPAWSFGAGYEIFHRKSFAIDLQYRAFGGSSSLPGNGFRHASSHLLMLGFSFY